MKICKWGWLHLFCFLILLIISYSFNVLSYETLLKELFLCSNRSDMHACWWDWDWIISHCFLQFTLPFQVPFLLFHHPNIPSSLCMCVYRDLELKTTLFVHVSAALFSFSVSLYFCFLHNHFLLQLKLDLDWLKCYYTPQTYCQWHPNQQVYTHTHALSTSDFVC